MTDDIPARLKRKIELWREDPCVFVQDVFGIEPTDQQVPILRGFAKPGAKVAVKAGHGVGKTATMALLAIWQIFLHRDSKSAATAPSAAQLRDALMSEIAKMREKSHPWVREQLEVSSMRVSVRGAESTQFITARTARPEDPSALQGIHAENMAFFIDEAFGVADKIFEAAGGSLSTPGARVLMCGNPTCTTGFAFEAFHKNKHLWQNYTLSCVGSPLVGPDYVPSMKEQYGEDSDVYLVRVLGEFPRASINQLISRELVEDAMKRTIGSNQYIHAPTILGVDVAWEGDDRSCVYLRQGPVARRLGVWRNVDNMTLGGMVNQFWTDNDADACFIDVGWGTGVIDYLRGIGRNPMPVNFGGASLSPEYQNKRTEMWCEMRKWLGEGASLQENKDLLEDLVGPEYYFMPNGKKMLEQKRAMKARGLSSPDEGDALALTFAAPVQKRAFVRAGGGRGAMSLHEYDPLA